GGSSRARRIDLGPAQGRREAATVRRLHRRPEKETKRLVTRAVNSDPLGAPFKPSFGLSGVVDGAPFKPSFGLSGVVASLFLLILLFTGCGEKKRARSPIPPPPPYVSQPEPTASQSP